MFDHLISAYRYATILAFDVKVLQDAKELAEHEGVKIFTANIIYHLFDHFTAYLQELREERKRNEGKLAVFPVVLKVDFIDETCKLNLSSL